MASSRRDLLDAVEGALGPIAPRFARALLEVPRERFVRPADVARANEDMPLPLDDSGQATISAAHAYVLSFDLVDLAPGDSLLELGSGTGYGATLAAHVVGPAGRVVTIEIDPALAARAAELTASLPNVHALAGDALTAPDAWQGATKIICTFAVAELPADWLARLPEGGVLVAPVGPPEGAQFLVRVERRAGDLVMSRHGGVRYVPNRSKVKAP